MPHLAAKDKAILPGAWYSRAAVEAMLTKATLDLLHALRLWFVIFPKRNDKWYSGTAISEAMSRMERHWSEEATDMSVLPRQIEGHTEADHEAAKQLRAIWCGPAETVMYGGKRWVRTSVFAIVAHCGRATLEFERHDQCGMLVGGFAEWTAVAENVPCVMASADVAEVVEAMQEHSPLSGDGTYAVPRWIVFAMPNPKFADGDELTAMLDDLDVYGWKVNPRVCLDVWGGTNDRRYVLVEMLDPTPDHDDGYAMYRAIKEEYGK